MFPIHAPGTTAYSRSNCYDYIQSFVLVVARDFRSALKLSHKLGVFFVGSLLLFDSNSATTQNLVPSLVFFAHLGPLLIDHLALLLHLLYITHFARLIPSIKSVYPLQPQLHTSTSSCLPRARYVMPAHSSSLSTIYTYPARSLFMPDHLLT